MRVTVIGTGYVGTVTGVCLAYLGHSVTCVDTDESKVRRLQNHDIPIYEPGLAELLVLAERAGGIDFTVQLAPAVRDSDVIFIAVGTPPLPTGEANLAYLEAAARSVGAAMDSSRFRVIVNKSTVPVGCGNLVETLVREGIREQSPWKEREIGFGIASNPEFLREGSAISDSLFPDRIVLGGQDERTLSRLHDLYEPLVSQNFPAPPFCARPDTFRTPVPVVKTTLTSAEMIKYAANAFLAMKIGFANEMANICEKVDADAPEVMAGIGLDSRIGTAFLNAGIGWGGSCFGKDVQSLMHIAGDYGYQARLLEASLAVNRLQRQLVIQKLQEKLYTEGPYHCNSRPGFQTQYGRPARCACFADHRASATNGSPRPRLRPDRHGRLPRTERTSQNLLLRVRHARCRECRRSRPGNRVAGISRARFERGLQLYGAADSGRWTQLI